MTQGEIESTTVLRREIGRHFERLRNAADLTMEEAAKAWQRSRSTLQRIEKGVDTVRFHPREVAALLDVYEASEEDRRLLTGLTETVGQVTSWWHDFDGSAIPKWFKLYVGLEDAAATIRTYEPALVPGLLQTRDYADHVIRTPVGVQDDEEVQRRMAVRVERQSLLTRYGAPNFTAILHEGVFRCVVGSHAVMAEQARHLLKASELPHITIRVLPFSTGLHTGTLSGGFSFLEFLPGRNGQPREKPTVYMEAVTGAMYLHKPHEIAAYNVVWQDLMDRVLDDSASRDFITRAAEEYSSG